MEKQLVQSPSEGLRLVGLSYSLSWFGDSWDKCFRLKSCSKINIRIAMAGSKCEYLLNPVVSWLQSILHPDCPSANGQSSSWSLVLVYKDLNLFSAGIMKKSTGQILTRFETLWFDRSCCIFPQLEMKWSSNTSCTCLTHKTHLNHFEHGSTCGKQRLLC